MLGLLPYKNFIIIFIIIAAIASLVGYYEFQLIDLQKQINHEKKETLKYKNKLSELNTLYDTTYLNLSKSNDLNIENVEKFNDYQRDVASSQATTNLLIKSKSKQIKRLIKSIERLKNLPHPDNASDIVIKDCKIYKGVEDENINNMSSIGK